MSARLFGVILDRLTYVCFVLMKSLEKTIVATKDREKQRVIL